MRIASKPLDEELRLQDLQQYGILDSVPEKEFDDLVELVAGIYGCPVAGISFIDRHRHWFKAKLGLPVEEIPREVSICSHTIQRDEILLVSDLREDDRFAQNPFVVADGGIRFYAGAPIVSTEGYRLGAVCVMDQQPRGLTEYQVRGLQIIAGQVSKLLELRLKKAVLRNNAEKLLRAEKVQQQRLLQNLEKERQHIGEELHENIAQGLAATRLYLDMAAEETPTPFLLKSKENINTMINQVRNLSKSIVPTTLAARQLDDLLQLLVARYKNHSFTLSYNYTGDKDLHPDLSLALYRVLEEALDNIATHAGAQKASIDVVVGDRVVIAVEDDGCGFEAAALETGSGINKMLSIVEYYNGTIDLDTAPDSGCRLLVSVPHFKSA